MYTFESMLVEILTKIMILYAILFIFNLNFVKLFFNLILNLISILSDIVADTLIVIIGARLSFGTGNRNAGYPSGRWDWTDGTATAS